MSLTIKQYFIYLIAVPLYIENYLFFDSISAIIIIPRLFFYESAIILLRELITEYRN